MIRNFLSLLLLAVAIVANAAPIYLNVELKDKTTESYELSARPVLSFPAGQMVISGEEIEAAYPISDVARYYFSDQKAGISDVLADANFAFRFVNPDVVGISLPGPVAVSVYDANGRMVAQTQGRDSIEVSLANCQAGIYIININSKKSIKIFKK